MCVLPCLFYLFPLCRLVLLVQRTILFTILVAELRRPEGPRERSPIPIETGETEENMQRIGIMKPKRFVFHGQHG